MKTTTVIYHRADFDGLFCYQIAKKFLGDKAEYIGWDYGDPYVVMPENGLVYILDLSPDCIDASQIQGTLWDRMVWIDHHKSAIEKFQPPSFPVIGGYRIDGVAACRLVWQWFTKVGMIDGNFVTCWLSLNKESFINRSVDEPYAVRLAGEYDIWDKRDPDAELFQHGLRGRALKDWVWDKLLDNTVSASLQGTGMESTESELICRSIIDSGIHIAYAKAEENSGIIKSYGFDIEFEGLKFLACNHARFNSHLFTAGIRPDHDALLGFNWDGKQWRVSLYHATGKEHHDLSLIAAKHGGGGHKGACGFRTKSLPFLT